MLNGIGTENRGASPSPIAASDACASRSTIALATNDQPTYPTAIASDATNARCACGRAPNQAATTHPITSGTVSIGSMMKSVDHIAGGTGNGHHSCVP